MQSTEAQNLTHLSAQLCIFCALFVFIEFIILLDICAHCLLKYTVCNFCRYGSLNTNYIKDRARGNMGS